jgi:hypothetical protein
LAARPAVSPDDLVDEPIVAPWDHYSPETVRSWLGPFRDARKDLDLQAESIDQCMNFAIRGLAVYCVPESVERFYGRPDVVFRPLLGVHPAAIALAWHRASANAAVASFVQLTRAVLKSENQRDDSIQSLRR